MAKNTKKTDKQIEYRNRLLANDRKLKESSSPNIS